MCFQELISFALVSVNNQAQKSSCLLYISNSAGRDLSSVSFPFTWNVKLIGHWCLESLRRHCIYFSLQFSLCHKECLSTKHIFTSFFIFLGTEHMVIFRSQSLRVTECSRPSRHSVFIVKIHVLFLSLNILLLGIDSFF